MQSVRPNELAFIFKDTESKRHFKACLEHTQGIRGLNFSEK